MWQSFGGLTVIFITRIVYLKNLFHVKLFCCASFRLTLQASGALLSLFINQSIHPICERIMNIK
ncbi:hypothetical protein HMPREF3293_00654 [Christensenella minuta]|uniref:Uncharacterized protein n=1 Tax=Christensenella minuta TaxID=626937 RepID=A0A136Q762_9FIRM|nr:hypothetical protein HMPREF3293_00654 [Christensenella minuta]